MLIMVLGKFLKYVFSVETRMLITFPGIHRITLGRQHQAIHCLTKGGVGYAGLGAQFHQEEGLMTLDNREAKGNVFNPARGIDPSGLGEGQGIVEKSEHYPKLCGRLGHRDQKVVLGPLFPTLTRKVFSFMAGMIAHCTGEINFF